MRRLVLPRSLELLKKAPTNLYTRKSPYIATIESVHRLTTGENGGDTYHIVIDHGGNVPFWEGQSYGILPPGTNPKRPGAPPPNRLYSLASSRYGDDLSGRTASLCVKRIVSYDPNDPNSTIPGICSNFLCDARPGDQVRIVGPFGSSLLLNEENPRGAQIMVGTGTGVAPFRGFLRRMFVEEVPFKFDGLAWLFLGVASSKSLLYHDEFERIARDFPSSFRYDLALSREMVDRSGGKFYVQHRIKERGKEVLELLESGGHIYFCGREEMMEGIQETFRKLCGDSWHEKLSGWKRNKQWHVDVY
ncbi:hypothetical protein SELMODRAFT_107413 [Selaginella moellendorffii]|uniref:ferredoxin--NADP(+) reductase n=1 Tax=Selaginella moellendorffii TaxID=88036 RepID=D8S310_SELML|nr:ferredoxin--NADP reductase, root-type isozyme, chloroplastic [Selaginella moellendorffii]EFJ21022.1 hypothetical protein SELMODRAFT_107413 [Selaginella moellendorffii]|eukprot:XP_002977684.1 ferredoxin--NADP reductase, root-type isozyme, chloroplastic [Selaginella moellendorffii]